ncbi:MAG: hypothetical protein APR63_09310 [Desulfuromonas sp. SDB]|nr:MAG: hypothetical protein APR63_09310 [Desulfuromonas sp. SDB]
MRFKEEIKIDEFIKEFKKLSKKYRTLNEDFNNFIKFSLEPFLLDQKNNKCSERLSDIGVRYPEIWKVKNSLQNPLREEVSNLVLESSMLSTET